MPRVGAGFDSAIQGFAYVGFYNREPTTEAATYGGTSARLYLGANGGRLSVTSTTQGHVMLLDAGAAALIAGDGDEHHVYAGAELGIHLGVGVQAFAGFGPEGGKVSAGVAVGF